MSDDRLPIEDLDEGLYLHRRTATRPGVEVVTIETSSVGAKEYYVRAEDYMAVQRERDNYRRTAALANAWRLGDRDEEKLRHIFDMVGLGDVDARALRELIESMKAGR